jgi:hypothetical protein
MVLKLAEDSFALGFIAGLLAGLFIGLPAGWCIAQALKPKEGSVVTLNRDAEGRIIDIVEKQL